MGKEVRLEVKRLAEDGWRLMKEGKPEKAREVFHQLLARLPGERPRARLYYRQGKSQIVVSRLGRAEPLSANENLGLEARLALANCCLECGLVEESIFHLERAVEVSPDRADAYCELGRAYEKGGLENLAASALRRALKLDPALPQAYHSLAQFYVKKERLQEAKRALRKALELSPEQHEYYLGLAACHMQQKNPGEALLLLHRAADKFPRAALIRETLAELYQRLGDYRGLMLQAQALVDLNPRNPQGYDLLAMARFQSGDLEGAVKSMERVVSLDPVDAFSRLKLAILVQQKGDIAGAMEQYLQVYSLASQGEIAQAALDAIEGLDHYQVQQILLRAAEDKDFRAAMEDDVDATILARGYRLSEWALEALRRVPLDAEIGDEPPITYH